MASRHGDRRIMRPVRITSGPPILIGVCMRPCITAKHKDSLFEKRQMKVIKIRWLATILRPAVNKIAPRSHLPRSLLHVTVIVISLQTSDAKLFRKTLDSQLELLFHEVLFG